MYDAAFVGVSQPVGDIGEQAGQALIIRTGAAYRGNIEVGRIGFVVAAGRFAQSGSQAGGRSDRARCQ